MSLIYIRRTYGVPAMRGASIVFFGGSAGPQRGEIRAGRGKYLRVRFEGSKRLSTLHPTWMVEYLRDSSDRRRITARL